MMRRLAALLLLAGCQARAPAVVSIAPVDAAAPNHVAPRPVVNQSGDLEWRILDKKFVEDPNGGAPKEMWVKIELRLGGQRLASFEFGEPDCSTETIPEEKVVARLDCYYAGGGDYVDVIERAPGSFEVVSYGQSESYADEPEPPKTDMRVVARFRSDVPITQQLVEPSAAK